MQSVCWSAWVIQVMYFINILQIFIFIKYPYDFYILAYGSYQQ